MYGVTKVTTELLSDYYFTKYGVDTRAVRFPGLISNVTLPAAELPTMQWIFTMLLSVARNSSAL